MSKLLRKLFFKKSKLQVVVFENVMLFAIGIAIFITLFGIFTVYQSNFTNIMVDDQLTEVENLVTSNILLIAERDSDINTTIILKIPQRVGGEGYEIELLDDATRNGVNITTLISRKSKFSPMYNLNLRMSGKALSTDGKLIIYKKGDQIII